MKRDAALQAQAVSQRAQARQLWAGAGDVQLGVERRTLRAQRRDGMQHDGKPLHWIQPRCSAELDAPVRETLGHRRAGAHARDAARCGTRALRRRSPTRASRRARPPSSWRSRAGRAADSRGRSTSRPASHAAPCSQWMQRCAPIASSANCAFAVRFQITSTSVPRRSERTAAMPRPQRHAGMSRQPQAETSFRVDRMRELAGDARRR